MRQKLIDLPGEMDESTIILGDFNTDSERNRSSRQKTNKDTMERNATTSQLDIMEIYR